ncbi:prion-like-(Q/N-rich) domain-bearing protein 25 [Coccinella septempunctata]|uniref:prion-like-(Q/N-rich) domain-bearing protein 25 n=1 Tax=Coccinella septempunctata TaxID=41139 RepID=UPI001D066126|nr:prion-like-(Q/N-rich) domain-bearing protein 25 [Coccinella septempunctata]
MFLEIGVVSTFVSFFVVSAVITTHNYDLIPCKMDGDCTHYNGFCLDGFCKCNNSTFSCKLNQDSTLVNKIGESCQSTNECNLDSAFCGKNNTCVCEDGYLPSENKMKCLRTATRLGDDCEESAQCYSGIPSTGCHKDKCVCQPHMHEFNGSCYKNVGLGETCQLIEECSMTPHATCVKTKCQCRENYVSNGTVCLIKANGINFTCDADLQCKAQLGEGSECSYGSCKCKEVFHFKASINQCVHDILLNEQCGEHRDCHQPGTGPSRLECLVGVCKCKSPYLEEGGFCINSSTSVVVIRSIILFLGTIFLII